MNINGYCPHCKADLDGPLVIDYPRSKFQPEKECLEYASAYEGWTEHGLNNRFGRQIGVYCQDRDRTVAWKCPDCNKEWNR